MSETKQFEVVVIGDGDPIPDWVPADLGDEITEAIEGGDRSVMLMRFGDDVEEKYDGGEPEDFSFGRDLAWIEPALRRAYEFGRLQSWPRRSTPCTIVEGDRRIVVFTILGQRPSPEQLREAEMAIMVDPNKGTAKVVKVKCPSSGMTEGGERPDFADFAASLRAESDGTAEIWRTSPEAPDKQAEIKALRELADKVEQVGKRYGFL